MKFTTPEFKTALKMVYEGSEREPEGLRLTVTRLCITKHKAVKQDQELLGIVETHEGMAFRCGAYELKSDSGDCYQHRSDLNRTTQLLGALVARARDEKACGQCGAQFALAMKKSGNSVDLSFYDCKKSLGKVT